MLLEVQLRLCQKCFCCWKTGLRLLSQSYSHRKAVNYYEILGVKSNASFNDIKIAFFEKSKKLHPDRDPANPALHSQFVELNEAYSVLSKDLSRKEYDIKRTRPYAQGPAFRSSSTHSTYTTSRENMHYWEQFHQAHAQKMSAEQWQKQRRKNLHLAGYCVCAMLLSFAVHVIIFRKLNELHKNFMDEKDRVITEIYKESKERARKQMEVLQQKHQEFLEKYKVSDGEDKQENLQPGWRHHGALAASRRQE